MPHTQKRKCSVNFGELISFLSMNEGYSRASLALHLDQSRLYVLNGLRAAFAEIVAFRLGRASEEACNPFLKHYNFIFDPSLLCLALQ
jgi:hypothetical protein